MNTLLVMRWKAQITEAAALSCFYDFLHPTNKKVPYGEGFVSFVFRVGV